MEHGCNQRAKLIKEKRNAYIFARKYVILGNDYAAFAAVICHTPVPEAGLLPFVGQDFEPHELYFLHRRADDFELEMS